MTVGVSPAFLNLLHSDRLWLTSSVPMCALQLVNCGLSDITIKALEARGITALFPIQKHVYEPAAAGNLLAYHHSVTCC